MIRQMLILIVLFAVNLTAQNKSELFLDSNSSDPIYSEENFEIQPIGNDLQNPDRTVNQRQNINNDTLSYKLGNDNWEEANKYRFGFTPGDIMLQWYKAPADLELNSVGFWLNTLEENRDSAFAVEVKVVKCNWTREKIDSFSLAAGTGIFDQQLGYYPATDSLYPYTAFLDDPERTGEWIPKNSRYSPFGEVYWESDTINFDILTFNNYTWVDVSLDNDIIKFNKNDIICVAVKNVTSFDSHRIRLDLQAAANLRIPSFKFYKTGRLMVEPPDTDPGYGWFIRPYYTFDIVAAVTFTGDLPPDIWNVTKLETTYSTGPRIVEATITDRNPDGQAGVASVKLIYNIEGESANSEVVMSGNGDIYTAEIPGQSRGTIINYRIEAEDVNGNTSVSITNTYKIFQPSGYYKLLLVLNGGTDSGYPTDYYLRNFIGSDDFDNWAYGPLEIELLQNYEWVIEICSSEPKVDNSEIIRSWLQGDGYRDYFLAGENWLGFRHNDSDKVFAPGDFEYDILGIKAFYNDVTFKEDEDESEPARLFPVEGSVLGGELYDALYQSDSDTLFYDPVYEIGNQYEQIDAFDAVDESNIDIYVQTKWIGGEPADILKGAFAHNHVDYHRVAFATFDPLALNSQSPGYFWWGDTIVSPLSSFIKWTGYRPAVEDKDLILSRFTLGQNYPNPFNPSTTIEYIVPINVGDENFSSPTTFIKLIIYDILGREVTTLVNKQQKPGKYRVKINSADGINELPSGVYFYRLSAGSYSDVKKMMILK